MTENVKASRLRWTSEEDELLYALVRTHGAVNWKQLAVAFQQTGTEKRSNRQLRDRWVNVLNPERDTTPWTLEEDLELFEAQKILGNKWATIAERLPGRKEYAIKNHFYAVLARTLRKKGRAKEVDRNGALANILHVLRFNYSKRIHKKLTSLAASSVPTPPLSSPHAPQPPPFLLPDPSSLPAILDFEKWGSSRKWPDALSNNKPGQVAEDLTGIAFRFSSSA